MTTATTTTATTCPGGAATPVQATTKPITEPTFGPSGAARSTPAVSTAPVAEPDGGVGVSDTAPGPAWLALSAALSDEAPVIADREDLIVTIAPGLGHGAPACFDPASATIEVDGTHLGVDPATVTPSEATDRDGYPVMWGLLTHECAHAQHSSWNEHLPENTSRGALAAATLLEESRIEAAHVRRRPDDRHWLRASATALILAAAPAAPGVSWVGGSAATNTATGPHSGAGSGDVAGAAGGSGMSRWDAAGAAGLLLARVDAGVLSASETASVAREVESVLGADTLAQLRTVWQAAHLLADGDTEGILALGARWCAVLGVDPDTTPTIALCSGPATGAARGPARDAGSGAAGTAASPVERAVAAALAELAARVAGETSPASEPASLPSGLVAAPVENHATMVVGSAAHTVFTRGGTRGQGSGDGPTATAGSRAPNAQERLAARRLGRVLSTAGVRDRARTVTTSVLPPGRLRMRGVLAGQAQRAAGTVPTAEPFTRITRAVVPTPPLRLGIACDVSGSMSQFTGPVASTAWILAHAAHQAHVPGSSTATVIFGNRVRPITHPGVTPKQVTEFAAVDVRHDIPTAIAALDQALGLSVPGAARLLVIVSDGLYQGGVRDHGQAQVTALRAAGCGVLWLAPEDKLVAPEPFEHVTVCTLSDPTATAHTIGRAATAALRATH